MSEEKSAYTPIPSVQRLPVYLHFLKDLRRGGQRSISCTQIAKQFNQLSVQVRKDLAITGISGRPRVGYKVDELIDAIESFRGWDKETTAFLVGAGSLGSAILGYQGFNEHGLRILMAFDSDPKKIGTTVHGYPVFSPEAMGTQARRYRVDIGILTVPASTSSVSTSSSRPASPSCLNAWPIAGSSMSRAKNQETNRPKNRTDKRIPHGRPI